MASTPVGGYAANPVPILLYNAVILFLECAAVAALVSSTIRILQISHGGEGEILRHLAVVGAAVFSYMSRACLALFLTWEHYEDHTGPRSVCKVWLDNFFLYRSTVWITVAEEAEEEEEEDEEDEMEKGSSVAFDLYYTRRMRYYPESDSMKEKWFIADHGGGAVPTQAQSTPKLYEHGRVSY